MRIWWLAFTVAVTLAIVVEPQTSRPVRVFEGARVIVGDGRAIDNAAFVVDGDTVTAVGPKRSVRVPAGAMRVDLTGKTVMPAAAAGFTRLGTLAAGKSADSVVVDGNPLDDIRNTRRISHVYLRGEADDRAALKSRWSAD